MADEARSRLGRGLASLIGDVGGEAAHPERPRVQRKVPIEFLKPNPRNPRRTFTETELAELAASVKERGIIQPILARAVRGANDSFEIIAGERRWPRARSVVGVSSPTSPISAASPRPNRDPVLSAIASTPEFLTAHLFVVDRDCTDERATRAQLASSSFSRWITSVASRR